MKSIKSLIKTRQAEIGLAIICVVAVLAVAFFLQPAPNRDIPAAAESGLSLAGREDGSAMRSSASRTESGSTISASLPPDSAAAGSLPGSGVEPSSASPAAGKGSSAGQAASPNSGKDKFQTDPVPEGKPAPVEPEDSPVDESNKLTCTISIRCDTILNNMDLFDQDKLGILPRDGVILAATTVSFSEGESVFDVLKRVTRDQRIQMEFEFTPAFNSAYIEGIHNLYEFDCGELSGWMYKVNGWFPNYGCSRYQLKQGDVIEWVYTCDLGKDVGGGNAVGQGAAS